MEDSTVADRLVEYFSDNHIPISEVATKTGIRYDTLQQILQGRVKSMGVNKFALIWQAYPELDAWYVMTGTQRQDYSHESAVALIDELQHFQKYINSAINKRIESVRNADRD